MVVVTSLQRQACSRDTPKGLRKQLHRCPGHVLLQPQTAAIIAASRQTGGGRFSHCLRYQAIRGQLQRAAAATATPETSLTLMRTAVIVLCSCASILCIATVFLVKWQPAQKLMHTARKLEDTLDIVNEELPSLSASARLTGLELADCIVEFSHLGQEVTGGLKAAARTMQSTEASLQEGGRALKHTWKNHIMPGINERVTASKEILNHSLHSNAGLTYADGTPAHMAATTKVAIQEARKMVAAMGALYQVASKGLGVLVYVSQSQEGGGMSGSSVPYRPGPVEELSGHGQGHVRSDTSQGDSGHSSAGVWPLADPQKKSVSDGEQLKGSSSGASTGSPNSLSGDTNGKVDPGGWHPPSPPSHREGL